MKKLNRQIKILTEAMIKKYGKKDYQYMMCETHEAEECLDYFVPGITEAEGEALMIAVRKQYRRMS